MSLLRLQKEVFLPEGYFAVNSPKTAYGDHVQGRDGKVDTVLRNYQSSSVSLCLAIPSMWSWKNLISVLVFRNLF